MFYICSYTIISFRAGFKLRFDKSSQKVHSTREWHNDDETSTNAGNKILKTRPTDHPGGHKTQNFNDGF